MSNDFKNIPPEIHVEELSPNPFSIFDDGKYTNASLKYKVEQLLGAQIPIHGVAIRLGVVEAELRGWMRHVYKRDPEEVAEAIREAFCWDLLSLWAEGACRCHPQSMRFFDEKFVGPTIKKFVEDKVKEVSSNNSAPLLDIPSNGR